MEAAAAVAAMMAEMARPDTPEPRRREIEASLSTFKAQPDAWCKALEFLDGSTNAFVQWFAASVLEHVVMTTWEGLAPQQKMDIVAFLASYLLRSHDALSHFALTKLLQVFVEMGLREAQGTMPHFIDNLLEWCNSDVTASLGFTCVRIWCEETGSRGTQQQKQLFVTKVEMFDVQLTRLIAVCIGTRNTGGGAEVPLVVTCQDRQWHCEGHSGTWGFSPVAIHASCKSDRWHARTK